MRIEMRLDEEFDLKMGFYIHLKLNLIIICSSLYMSYFEKNDLTLNSFKSGKFGGKYI